MFLCETVWDSIQFIHLGCNFRRHQTMIIRNYNQWSVVALDIGYSSWLFTDLVSFEFFAIFACVTISAKILSRRHLDNMNEWIIHSEVKNNSYADSHTHNKRNKTETKWNGLLFNVQWVNIRNEIHIHRVCKVAEYECLLLYTYCLLCRDICFVNKPSLYHVLSGNCAKCVIKLNAISCQLILLQTEWSCLIMVILMKMITIKMENNWLIRESQTVGIVVGWIQPTLMLFWLFAQNWVIHKNGNSFDYYSLFLEIWQFNAYNHALPIIVMLSMSLNSLMLTCRPMLLLGRDL